MKRVLKFLAGKKASIATISGFVLIYLLNSGMIGPNEAQLISGIMAALGITANVTGAMINSKPKKD